MSTKAWYWTLKVVSGAFMFGAWASGEFHFPTPGRLILGVVCMGISFGICESTGRLRAQMDAAKEE